MKISELEVLTTPSDDDLIVLDAHVTSDDVYETRVMRREDYLAGYVKIKTSNDNGETQYSVSSDLAGYLDQYMDRYMDQYLDQYIDQYLEEHDVVW